MAHPLIIDEQVLGFIKRVSDHAEANRIDFQNMKAIAESIQKPVGDNDNYVCYLPVGFRVVYSIEEHPLGWCRHLSVSVDTVGKMPSIPAVEMIMREFGFTGTINDQLNVWVEKERAINVLQKI